MDNVQKIRDLELQIKDWLKKLEDKQKECDSLSYKIDQKRMMYEEMMAKRQETETNKGNIIDDLEKIIVQKD